MFFDINEYGVSVKNWWCRRTILQQDLVRREVEGRKLEAFFNNPEYFEAEELRLKNLWEAFYGFEDSRVRLYFTREDAMLNKDVELFEVLVDLMRGNSKNTTVGQLYEKFFNSVFLRGQSEVFLRKEVCDELRGNTLSNLSTQELKALISRRLVRGNLNNPGFGAGAPYWVLSSKGDRLVSTYDGTEFSINQQTVINQFYKQFLNSPISTFSPNIIENAKLTAVNSSKWHTAGMVYSQIDELFKPLSAPVYNEKSKKWTASGWMKQLWSNTLAAKKLANSFGTPFHAVSPSPLPFLASMALFFTAGHIICAINTHSNDAVRLGFHAFWPTVLLGIIMAWINEVSKEEIFGNHTLEVQNGFRIGIVLFIVSEAMLFLSFFWAFFHLSLNASVWAGGVFPPVGLVEFYWWRIPLLNTLILLTSGYTLSYAHKLIVNFDANTYRRTAVYNLSLTGFVLNDAVRTSIVRHYMLTLPEAAFTQTDRMRGFVGESTTGFSLPIKDKSSMVFLPLVGKMFSSTTKSRDLLKNMFRLGDLYGLPLTRSEAFNVGFTSLSNPEFDRKVAYSAIFFKDKSYRYIIWLADTVLRGFVFLIFQSFEYIQSLFTIRTSVYGSVFFTLTGLHGFHVFVGAVMLLVCVCASLPRSPLPTGPFSLIESVNKVQTQPVLWQHRVAFDGAAWYWHFVDVVWLLVFIFVYWWGASA